MSVAAIGFRGPGGPAYPEGAARYGYATRSVRCDCCLRDYLPQHVSRRARWWWICGNCAAGGRGWFARTPGRARFRKYAAPGWALIERPCREAYHFDRAGLPDPVPA